MEPKEDLYPSRGKRDIRIAPRHDPVIYCSNPGQSPLAYDLVERYRDQGFLILDDVFSPAEVAGLQAELDRLREDKSLRDADEVISEPGSGEIRSIFKVHTISPVFARLAEDMRLAGLASYLLGDEVYVHQSRLNYKPGFRGKEFYWHSDFETWHVEDGMPAMRALSMSISLTRNAPHNGPLMVIPGSHKDYVVCGGDTPDDHFRTSLKKQEYGVPDDRSLAELASKGDIVCVVCKPGSVIVFDCNLMHGSNSNITPDPRSNAFFVYNAVSNRVVAPYCDKPPRPEYICAREHIEPLIPKRHGAQEFAPC